MLRESPLEEKISSIRDIADAGEVCRQIASQLGFGYFLYGLRLAVSLDRPYQFIVSGYPKEWRARYDEAGYMMIDPVLARGATTIVPFGWDELLSTTPAARKLFSEAAGYGLNHGLTVPMHCINGEFGLMSLARREPLPVGEARVQLMHRAMWLCANLQEKMRHIVLQTESAAASKLSGRERECLGLAAQGMSAPRISTQLGIAPSTVVFHLNSAERKLGVRNRGQAIARAVGLGAIDPEGYPLRIASSQRLIETPDRHQ